MRSGDLDDEFLPSVLRVAEYSYFIEQITLLANRPELQQLAQESAAGGDAKSAAGDDTITGVWRVDKKRTDFSTLDSYLGAIRVPAVFRGLAKGTFYTNKHLILIHDGASIQIVAESPFGMQRSVYDLDDASHQLPNPWGRMVECSAGPTRNGGVRLTQHEPSGLPRGSLIQSTWTRDGSSLTLLMECEIPGEGREMFEMIYQKAS